jgi:type IV pilus assembly protein PilZ
MNDFASDPAIVRPGVFSLVVRSKAALYAAWMPFLRGGGLFLPSNRDFNLGDEVLILLTLLDESARLPLQGQVAWVNPPHAANNRPQGIGVQLQGNDTCRALRKRVEELLGGALQSSRPTLTL